MGATIYCGWNDERAVQFLMELQNHKELFQEESQLLGIGWMNYRFYFKLKNKTSLRIGLEVEVIKPKGINFVFRTAWPHIVIKNSPFPVGFYCLNDIWEELSSEHQEFFLYHLDILRK